MAFRVEDSEDNSIYKVVINHEEQYSIWPAERANPAGWNDAGKTGLKAECLAYIKETWTDMRPLSLRKLMAEAAQETVASTSDNDCTITAGTAVRDDLVNRLSASDHHVEISLRPEKSAQAFLERIKKGYVYMTFTETRGGTELGVKLDQTMVKTDQADFAASRGSVHLEGGLTLNFRKVRVQADVDLATLSGVGRLQPLDA